MPIEIKRGLSENGWTVENREFRPAKEKIKSTMFMNPGQLLIDVLQLLFLIFYLPLRSLVMYFIAEPKSLKGKVCFVTGSARGLGREFCLALAKEGAIIAGADINENLNKETGGLLDEVGAKYKLYKLNVADKAEVEKTLQQAEADLGPIYLLVNNAALVMPVFEPSEDYVRAIFNVNTLGPIWTMQACLPKMKERNEGHILNISSIAGIVGLPCISLYSATKAALTSYTQAIREELNLSKQQYDIHLTCIHPSIMNTSADYVDLVKSRIPIENPADVVQKALEGVKYNKGDITYPSSYWFLLNLIRLLPSELYTMILKVSLSHVLIPNETEARKMGHFARLEECSKIGLKQ